MSLAGHHSSSSSHEAANEAVMKESLSDISPELTNITPLNNDSSDVIGQITTQNDSSVESRLQRRHPGTGDNDDTNFNSDSGYDTSMMEQHDASDLTAPKLQDDPESKEEHDSDEKLMTSSSSNAEGRQVIRSTMNRFFDLIDAKSKSSSIVRFGVKTTKSAMSLTPTPIVEAGDEWIRYMDTSIDDWWKRINTTLSKLTISEGKTSGVQSEGQVSSEQNILLNEVTICKDDLHETEDLNLEDEMHFWTRLKTKFASSKWFAKVDEILLGNEVVVSMIKTVSATTRPAELFYNTMTEEFIGYRDNCDEFLEAVAGRMGPAWDHRLAPLARAYFVTAWAVLRVVGMGHFVSGAIRLCRTAVHNVIDELLLTWDEALGATERFVDQHLPDYNTPHLTLNQPVARPSSQLSLQRHHSHSLSQAYVQNLETADNLDVGSSSHNNLSGYSPRVQQYAADDNIDPGMINQPHDLSDGEYTENYCEMEQDLINGYYDDNDDDNDDDDDNCEEDGEDSDEEALDLDAFDRKLGLSYASLSGVNRSSQQEVVGSIPSRVHNLSPLQSTMASSSDALDSIEVRQSEFDSGSSSALGSASASGAPISQLQMEVESILSRHSQNVNNEKLLKSTTCLEQQKKQALNPDRQFKQLPNLSPTNSSGGMRTVGSYSNLASTSSGRKRFSSVYVQSAPRPQRPQGRIEDLSESSSSGVQKEMVANAPSQVTQVDVQRRSQRSVRGLLSKLRTRVQQRIDYYSPMGILSESELNVMDMNASSVSRSFISLSETGNRIRNALAADWWRDVDEQLLKNTLVQALAQIRRPADHFYNACVSAIHEISFASTKFYFSSQSNTDDVDSTSIENLDSDSYLDHLRRMLGATWNESLIPRSLDVLKEFKFTASSVSSAADTTAQASTECESQGNVASIPAPLTSNGSALHA